MRWKCFSAAAIPQGGNAALECGSASYRRELYRVVGIAKAAAPRRQPAAVEFRRRPDRHSREGGNPFSVAAVSDR